MKDKQITHTVFKFKQQFTVWWPIISQFCLQKVCTPLCHGNATLCAAIFKKCLLVFSSVKFATLGTRLCCLCLNLALTKGITIVDKRCHLQSRPVLIAAFFCRQHGFLVRYLFEFLQKSIKNCIQDQVYSMKFPEFSWEMAVNFLKPFRKFLQIYCKMFLRFPQKVTQNFDVLLEDFTNAA